MLEETRMKKLMRIGVGVMLTVVASLSLCAHAEVYDDFNDDGTWVPPTGTSPSGKWTYSYGGNPSWAPLHQSGGVLKMSTVADPGHSVTSTQSWDMPQNPGESVAFEFKMSNLTFNGSSSLKMHTIRIVGDVYSFSVHTAWADNYWHLQDDWGLTTSVAIPSNETWRIIRITFSETDTGKTWTTEFEDAAGNNLGTYGRNLHDGVAWTNMWKNTSAQVQMSSGFGRAKYDYVDVAVVPEPATLSILAVGSFFAIRRRRR